MEREWWIRKQLATMTYSISILMAFDEGALEKIWANLMSHLCPRHRTQARIGRPTDYRVEDLHTEHYPSYGGIFLGRILKSWLIGIRKYKLKEMSLDWLHMASITAVTMLRAGKEISEYQLKEYLNILPEKGLISSKTERHKRYLDNYFLLSKPIIT